MDDSTPVTPYRPQVGRADKHASNIVHSSPVAMKNAAAWNKPGGGYDKFKQGDAQREKDLPVGGIALQRDAPFSKKEPK